MPEDRTLGVPRRSGSSKARRERLMRRRAQVEQWISEERSPIREVELIQQHLDVSCCLQRPWLGRWRRCMRRPVLNGPAH
jgi:hypothetical protein